MIRTCSLVALLLLGHVESVHAEEMEGMLVFGHEVRTLQMCGDTRTFVVRASEGESQQVASDDRRLATGPYEPVYVRLEGELVDQPTTGLTRDYDGEIEVKKDHSLSKVQNAGYRTQSVLPMTESSADPKAKTYVFVCENQSSYSVRTTATDAWFFHSEGTLTLSSVPVEDGALYSDGSFRLWIKGQTAEFGEIGDILHTCRNDRRRAIWGKAKLDGADFRAVGNEPGWNLEIREKIRLFLVTDYGTTRVELTLPEPTVDSATRTTRWETGELTLEIFDHPCTDSMSGESFDVRAVVTWKGKTLRGCGRTL